ncbi:MAG: restriction endonuclease subunit S [Actinomycetaceae bacterium]|nr:restriction endonuclease subunit S [Actinomycetaceae bacterium]
MPENWAWERLGKIGKYIQRGRSPRYVDYSDYTAISQKCIQWEGFKPEEGRPYSADTFAKLPVERLLKAGDLLWNSTGTGTVGRAIVVPDHAGLSKMAPDSHVTLIRTWAKVSPRYLWAFIAAPEIQNNIDELTSGTTKQKELNLSTIVSLPIPLPPVAEQERIVAKLDAMLPLVRELQETLT